MRQLALRLHDELVVDNFAGGGGASLGIEWALGRSPDIAVNHDPEAIAMHEANHPNTRHICGNVWDVNPKGVTNGRRVGLAWFSPDCTFHSKARGAKPFRDPKSAKGRRGLAWVVTRWARAVKPRVCVVENVEELQDWGPLDANGRPDPERAGLTFRRWVGQLRACGYEVEWRELRACDFGAPTIRKRLFVIARCDGKPIVWPEPTHGPGRAKPWRTAAECIEWSLPCPSIFLTREEGKAIGVKRPLVEKTLARIARGVRRFVLEAPTPFIVRGLGPHDRLAVAARDHEQALADRRRPEVAGPELTPLDLVAAGAELAHPSAEGEPCALGVGSAVRVERPPVL
jgi:DNA (cytosine-5)-methyltransferase 1